MGFASIIVGCRRTRPSYPRAVRPRPSASIAPVQLFLVAFQQPIPFGISAVIVILMIYIILRVGDVRRGRLELGHARSRTRTRKFLFPFLFIAWALVFGVGAPARPARGRELARTAGSA